MREYFRLEGLSYLTSLLVNKINFTATYFIINKIILTNATDRFA